MTINKDQVTVVLVLFLEIKTLLIKVQTLSTTFPEITRTCDCTGNG